MKDGISRRLLVFLAALLVALPGTAAWIARPGTVKVYARKANVFGPAGSRAIPPDLLAELHAELLEDTATFAVLQLPSASASPTILGDIADLVEIREDFDRLEFDTLPLDARQPSPSYPTEWQRNIALPSPARDSFVIQFAAPPRSAWLTQIRAAAVTILDYVPMNGYVVLADPVVLDQLVSDLPIQVSRLHQLFHKVSAEVRAATGDFSGHRDRYR